METIFNIIDLTEFKQIINTILDNLYYPPKEHNLDISLEVIESTKNEIKQVLISNDFNSNKVTEFLLHKPWGQKDRIDFIVTEIDKRKGDFIANCVQEHNSLVGEVLMEFEWALKLVLGTSQLRTQNYQILQLITRTLQNKQYKNTIFEIRKEILTKIIKLLECVE